MTPARILLTGAAGFVGRHLLGALRRAFPAAHLVAAVRQEELAAAGPGADAITAFDLLEPRCMEPMVAAVRPDACIHLAAFSDVAASFSAPDDAWRANVDGPRALATALLRLAPHCLLLHIGSAEAYGLSFQAGTQLDEQAPLRPANPYAAAKAAADLALGEMALRGLRVVRMRPLNHVGPGQSPRFAVAAFARQIALIELGRQEPVLFTGALDRARDFLDVRDVCAAYVAAIARADSLVAGAVFNIASGVPRRMSAVLDGLLAIAGLEARVETAPAALRPTDLLSTSCSSDAARSALGWQPAIAWHDTLRDVLADWRQRVRASG